MYSIFCLYVEKNKKKLLIFNNKKRKKINQSK